MVFAMHALPSAIDAPSAGAPPSTAKLDTISYMPGVLRDLSRACGSEAALALASLLGGVRLKVPRRPRAEHPIARTCGLPVLEWLAAEYGGCSIDIPFGPAHPAKRRGAEIARLSAAGESGREIALALGVTERTVRAWRRRVRNAVPPAASPCGLASPQRNP